MRLFGIAVMTLTTIGCGDAVKVSVTTGPSFAEAWLASDQAGANRVTEYQPTDTVYVKADLIDAQAGTEVTASFVAVEVDHPDVPANTEIGVFTQKFDGELNRINFDLTNDGPMPPGSYKVDLSISGKLATSLSFTIPSSASE